MYFEFQHYFVMEASINTFIKVHFVDNQNPFMVNFKALAISEAESEEELHHFITIFVSSRATEGKFMYLINVTVNDFLKNLCR